MAFINGYGGGVINDAPGQTPMDYLSNVGSGDASSAAIGVAVMIVGAALFLTILKRSGFRAMVAVGRS